MHHLMSQLISPTLGGSSKTIFSSEACGCHKQHLACTSCCNCSGREHCCNPYSVTPETNSEEEGHDADDDYFQVDTVIVEEEESGDIQEDYNNAEEDFELELDM